MSQPRIAAIERSRNVTIDVLEQYAKAVGGRLEVAVITGQRKVSLLPGASRKAPTTRRSRTGKVADAPSQATSRQRVSAKSSHRSSVVVAPEPGLLRAPWSRPIGPGISGGDRVTAATGWGHRTVSIRSPSREPASTLASWRTALRNLRSSLAFGPALRRRPSRSWSSTWTRSMPASIGRRYSTRPANTDVPCWRTGRSSGADSCQHFANRLWVAGACTQRKAGLENRQSPRQRLVAVIQAPCQGEGRGFESRRPLRGSPTQVTHSRRQNCCRVPPIVRRGCISVVRRAARADEPDRLARPLARRSGQLTCVGG